MNDERKKLHIAIVCDAVTDCVAGSFVSTLNFAERLVARGNKVIFIAARSPRNPEDVTKHGEITAFRFGGFLLPKSEGQLYIAIPSKTKIKEILRKENIDIVHHMIPTPLAVSATRSARELGIKVVAHSHTQPENLTMHIPFKFIQKPINHYFYRYLSWLYKQANALIYPSQFALERLSEIRTDITKLVISNGVDIKQFIKVPTDSFFEKFSLPKDTVNIFYMGRLHPEKSLHTLISAMPHVIKKHPKTHLFLGGFGHLDAKLMQQTKELGMEKHISFLGRISHEEKIAAYNACDIFVLPSLAELEGMVVLEAMACGKPIVIADSPESASTFFVDGNGYLFEPGNEKDLATQISHLVSDEELRKHMGEKSFKKSREYDIDESVSHLETLYYSLLEK